MGGNIANKYIKLIIKFSRFSVFDFFIFQPGGMVILYFSGKLILKEWFATTHTQFALTVKPR